MFSKNANLKLKIVVCVSNVDVVTMGKPSSSSSSSSSSASSIQTDQDSSPASPTRKMSLSNTPTTMVAATAKPTWLISNLAYVEERMKMVTLNTNNKIIKTPEDQDNCDTFAERAEAYYKTRPQLFSLLQDLYNSYLILSDRYIHTITKTTSSQSQISHACPRRRSSQTSTVEYFDYYDQYETNSDVESSLSYHQHLTSLLARNDVYDNEIEPVMASSFDAIVAEIVMKNVECDILLHEVNNSYSESSRKIELQTSLLDVLESERLVLVNESAKLAYKVGALVEESKCLASESLFLRRKAGELARCLLQTREDCRVSLLSRKIEDLEGQICGLEKRNKEYYMQLVEKEKLQQGMVGVEKVESVGKKKDKGSSNNEVDFHVCFQIGKMKRRGVGSKRGSSWWGKVKNLDMFMCGLNSTSAA